MAFNITDFRSSFKKFEPASPTNYEVNIIRPPILIYSNGINQLTDNTTENNLKYRCFQCAFPGKMMNTSDRLTYGPNRKVVTNAVYQDVTFSFIVSDNMQEKNYFSNWHNAIVNNTTEDGVSSHDVQYYSSYVGSLNITQFNKNGDKSLIVELQEAYPINVEEVALGWEMNNEYTRINVTMAYRIWVTKSL